MKKIIIWLAVLTVILILNSTAFTAERPNSFGLEVGKTTYEDCIKILKTRDWNYQEYEKKQFKSIDEKDCSAVLPLSRSADCSWAYASPFPRPPASR